MPRFIKLEMIHCPDFRPPAITLIAMSKSTLSPQVNKSTAAKSCSGQAWTAKWDSEITTTPLTPCG